MQDIQDLIQMNKTKLKVQAQGRVQKVADDIADLLINKLTKLIK